MTGPVPDPLRVRPGEKGVVRVFSLDMPPQQARFLREPGAAEQVLGVEGLDPTQLDVFPVSDLEELGLDGYLTEGCGIPQDRIDADRTRLRALDGWVMVIRSRAFDGRPATLRPDPSIHLAGIYAEPGVDWTGGPAEPRAAQPVGAGRPSPRQARATARRIGASAFTVVMLIVAAIIYYLVVT